MEAGTGARRSVPAEANKCVSTPAYESILQSNNRPRQMVQSEPGDLLRQTRQDDLRLCFIAPACRAHELPVRWSSPRNQFCDLRRAILAGTRAAPLAGAAALSPPRSLALPMHLPGVLCAQELGKS